MPFHINRILPLTCLVILHLSACSSFLYYPERKPLFDPKTEGFRKPEEVFFTSRNGNRLHGWYFKSKGRKKPKGRILFFHGNAQNVTTHFGFLYWILNEGYDYFIFDYQGYGKSEGSPSPKRTVEDGLAALRWAHARQPSLPLIVFGQSLGGSVALRVVAEAKETIPIAYLIVDSTFHSYQAVARRVLARHWFTWPLYPLAGLLLSDRYAAHKKIADIFPIPLLVIHGDQDSVVDFRLGEKVFELARPPKEFIRIPGGQHIDAFLGHKGKYRRELLKRLNRIHSTVHHRPKRGLHTLGKPL